MRKVQEFWASSLWVRLVTAFAIIILLGAVGVTALISTITSREFQIYVTQDSARWAQWLAPQLSAYYATTGSWDGVERFVLGSGGMPMMMGGHMRPEDYQQMLAVHQRMMSSMPSGMQEDMWTAMGLRVLVVDVNGRVLVDSHQELTGSAVPEDVLAQAEPIRLGEETVGAVLVTPIYTRSGPESVFLQGVTRAVITVSLGMGLLALLVAAFIARQITAPLRRLAAAAHQVARGNLTVRVPVHGQDELADVSMAFNRMALALEQQQRLRRQLMADIAHELRTPLSVIQAHVEALMDGIFPPTAENLQPIHEQTLLLSRLINDLRELSLAEAGELQMTLEPLDLGHLARKVVSGMQSTAQERNIRLHIKVEDPLPLVKGDAQRLEQVLLNLLSNALRYTPPGGDVFVRVWHEREQVFCQVRDTGPGIRPEDLPHVFERFWRADRSRARSTGGTGLGLAIARKWLEAHGGRIWAESTPGQGAVFTFVLKSLPADEAEEA